MTEEEMIGYSKVFTGATPPWLVQQRLDEAEGRLRHNLAIERARHGPDHPRTAGTRYELGSVLHDKGQLSAAEEIFCHLLPIVEKVHGLEHQTTVKLLIKFAEVLRDNGKMDEAEAMFYRALAAEQKSTDDVGGAPRKGAAQAAWGKRVQEFFHPLSQPQLPEL